MEFSNFKKGETMKTNEWYWLFRDKKTGYITVSRHPRPDFLSMYPTEGEIRKHYDRMIVLFRKGVFNFEAKIDYVERIDTAKEKVR